MNRVLQKVVFMQSVNCLTIREKESGMLRVVDKWYVDHVTNCGRVAFQVSIPEVSE